MVDMLIPSIPSWILVPLLVLAILDAVWKGIAMWKAGRNNQLYWFIVLLVVNSAGILPIIYILFFQKKASKVTGKKKK